MSHKWLFSGLCVALICGGVQAQSRYQPEAWRAHAADAMQAGLILEFGVLATNQATISRSLIEGGKCKASARRTLPASSSTPTPKVSLSLSGQCYQEGAVVMEVSRPISENSYETQNIWVFSTSDIGLTEHGVTQGVSDSQWMTRVEGVLKDNLRIDPIDASKLPPWPEDKVVPTLPAGLKWRSGTERSLYEAVRSGHYKVYCVYGWTMTCAADLPERIGGMVPMLSVGNLSELYEVKDTKAALAVLIGETPQLTPAALSAASAKLTAMLERATDAAIRDISVPEPKMR